MHGEDTHTPSNFAVVDVEATLGHVAHAPLRVAALVGVEVMHVRRLLSHFKVPDYTVALQAPTLDARVSSPIFQTAGSSG